MGKGKDFPSFALRCSRPFRLGASAPKTPFLPFKNKFVLTISILKYIFEGKGAPMQFVAVRINADSRTEERYSAFPDVKFYKKVWENSPQDGFHECVNFKNFGGNIKGYLPPTGHCHIPSTPFGIIFVTAKTATRQDLKDRIIGIQINCQKIPEGAVRTDVPRKLKEFLGKKNELIYHYIAPYEHSLLFSHPVENGSELLQPSEDRNGNTWTRISIQPILDKNLPHIFATIRKTLIDKEREKWDDLIKCSGSLPNVEDIERDLETEVSRLLRMGKKPILLKGNQHPSQKIATVTTFDRSPSVVAATLQRANGICECCQQPAPFNRKSDRTPYLEVHHKTPLAEGGADVLENTEALCPNCHRKRHFG